MPTTLNREARNRLLEEDIEWLRKQPRSLERDHIEGILQWLIRKEVVERNPQQSNEGNGQ